MGEASSIRIEDVVAATGIPSSTLRFYERRGLIRPSGRAGGRRLYSQDIFDRLALIDLYKQAGFTVGETAKLLRASLSQVRSMAREKIQELDQRIATAQRAKQMLEHSFRCPNPTYGGCPRFTRWVRAHGEALRDGQGRTTRPQNRDRER
jgi:DNA-binding transcriptional MerR regulator